MTESDDSERQVLHEVALAHTGGEGLLPDFDAWCAARREAHLALVRSARPEIAGDEA